jgi:hypothetical protein
VRSVMRGLLALGAASALSLTFSLVTAQAAPVSNTTNHPNVTATSCTPSQLLGNPGFETGSAAPWQTTSSVINTNGSGETAHSGSYFAWLDGYGTTHTDTLSQQVTIPAGCHAVLSFWLHIDTQETTTTTAYDTLTLQVGSTTLANWSNLNAAANSPSTDNGYAFKSLDLSSFAGQTVTILFTGSEDYELATSFIIDDTALNTL